MLKRWHCKWSQLNSPKDNNGPLYTNLTLFPKNRLSFANSSTSWILFKISSYHLRLWTQFSSTIPIKINTTVCIYWLGGLDGKILNIFHPAEFWLEVMPYRPSPARSIQMTKTQIFSCLPWPTCTVTQSITLMADSDLHTTIVVKSAWFFNKVCSGKEELAQFAEIC